MSQQCHPAFYQMNPYHDSSSGLQSNKYLSNTSSSGTNNYLLKQDKQLKSETLNRINSDRQAVQKSVSLSDGKEFYQSTPKITNKYLKSYDESSQSVFLSNNVPPQPQKQVPNSDRDADSQEPMPTEDDLHVDRLTKLKQLELVKLNQKRAQLQALVSSEDDIDAKSGGDEDESSPQTADDDQKFQLIVPLHESLSKQADPTASLEEQNDANPVNTDQIKEMIRNNSNIPQDEEEKRGFMFKAISPKSELQCRIQRQPNKGPSMQFPLMAKSQFSYKLFIDKESEQQNSHMLTAIKIKTNGLNGGSIYAITCQKNIHNDLESGRLVSVCAYLKANFLGTEFILYEYKQSLDNGSQILDVNQQSQGRQLMAVLYETNMLGMRGPRKMTIITRRQQDDGVNKEVTDERIDNLAESYRTGLWDNLNIMINKQPVWNEATQAYCLNFHGRVTRPSVKNFQIVTEEKIDQVLVQFGKIASNSFTLDLKYPFCPIQAFALALSSFDSKLACE
ncbi:hypothetical protein MIR68_003383 [Amoeboaphelidium protococcarum]|nr:hypothetical protein MIR68_003383 [Amoeboaphelidium protococcarum]